MKPMRILKIGIDAAMTVALFFLMGYQLWGDEAHEWVGAALFVLFILHHVLNWRWFRSLLKGRYSPVRIFHMVVDFMVLLSMLCLMYSGIVLSRYAFTFLPIGGGLSLTRKLHILGSYWGFLLMGAHLGLHWNMFIGMVKRKEGSHIRSKTMAVTAFMIAAAISIYGAYVLFKRDLFTNLLLQNEFVFLDYDEPALLFYIDYFALMGLCIFIVHYLLKLLKMIYKRREIFR